jgi:soluble lytic murein transglycosylase-like protein
MGGTLRISRHFRDIFAIVLALMPASAALAATPMEVQRMIIEESMNSRVPPALALAVARVESNFEPRAESPVGAKGVMQLMPKTARDVFGVREDELWNPRFNIQLGISYLEQLYDQYGGRWDSALSHYNGGTLDGGFGTAAVPHDYTRKYVADVLRWQRIYTAGVFRQQPGAWPVNTSRPRPVARRPAPGARPWAASEQRPWRKKPAIDPLEFNDWAEVEQRRLQGRRGLDDFARRE